MQKAYSELTFCQCGLAVETDILIDYRDPRGQQAIVKFPSKIPPGQASYRGQTLYKLGLIPSYPRFLYLFILCHPIGGPRSSGVELILSFGQGAPNCLETNMIQYG